MIKPHIFPFQIAYADTDAGGIVYHARYIEIAERARMNFMCGIMPPNGDIGFVVKKLSIKYQKPLLLSDDFFVETRILKLGAASLEFEHKFVKDGDIYAVLTGIAAYIGRDMKPKRTPDSIVSVMTISKSAGE